MTQQLRIAPGLAMPIDVVTEAIGIVATRGAGKSFTSAVVIEEAFGAGVQCCVVDVTGVYHGLRSSADGKKPGLGIYVFGGQHGDLPLEPTAGAFMADLIVDSGHSFVLDISDFKKAEARRFVGDFLDRLYERKARSRTTMLLVIDEADEFAPQKPRGDSIKSLGAMETITKRGRSRGVGVVLITQRTQALNKDVLDLIETLIVMRQLAERSRDAVKGWIADKEMRDDAGVLETLQTLPTGTAWVWSPLRGILKKVNVRRIRTFDSYRTPKPGEKVVEPAARVKLDLDALGEKMRATVERAKSNDPTELRRQIKKLERELEFVAETAPKTVTETVEVEKVVEVPMVQAHDVEEIGRQLDRLFAIRDDLLAALHDATGAAAILSEQLGRAVAPPPAPPARKPQQAPAARAPQRPKPAITVALDGVSASQQRILDALAWFEWVGVQAPSRAALAPMAKSKPTSGGFKNNLGALRSAGLLDYPQPNRVALTDDGRAVAAAEEGDPTDEALQEAVLAAVTGSQASILRALIDAYPAPLSREELADQVGVPTTSGGFKNNLGALRTLEVLDYPEPGYVVATPILFPVSERV